MAIQQRFIGMQIKGICFAEMPPLEEITCDHFCFCYVLQKEKKNFFGLGPSMSWRLVQGAPCPHQETAGIGSSKKPSDPIKGIKRLQTMAGWTFGLSSLVQLFKIGRNTVFIVMLIMINTNYQ